MRYLLLIYGDEGPPRRRPQVLAIYDALRRTAGPGRRSPSWRRSASAASSRATRRCTRCGPTCCRRLGRADEAAQAYAAAAALDDNPAERAFLAARAQAGASGPA